MKHTFHFLLVMALLVMFQGCEPKQKAIAYLDNYTVKEGTVDSFREAYSNICNVVGKALGNVEVKFYQSNKQSNLFYVYSVWETEETYITHKSSEVFQTLEKAISPILASTSQHLQLESIKPIPNHDAKTTSEPEKVQNLVIVAQGNEEYRDSIIKQLEHHATESRKEEGNLVFDFYTVKDQPNTYVIYERWKTVEALREIHVKQPYFIQTSELLGEAFVEKLGAYVHNCAEVK